MDETVIINKEEYDYLIARVAWLGDLEAAGVDNWQGYDYAIDLRNDRGGIIV